MKEITTKIVSISPNQIDDVQVLEAGKLLAQGKLVVIPTETVYGLGANALNPSAVKRIYEAKGRPSDNPLIVHISDIGMMNGLVSEIPEKALALAQRFWPGPLTLIMKKTQLVPPETSGGLDTVAVRYPSHPVASRIIAAAGVPVAAPSANLSGKPSPTRAEHVIDDLSGRVEMIVDSGPCGVGVESTVLSLAGDVPRLLRPGYITPKQMEAVIGKIEVDPAVLEKLEQGAVAASPGMKYLHYSPKAHVVILKGNRDAYCGYVNAEADKSAGVYALCFDEDEEQLAAPYVSYGCESDPAGQARRLFDALRSLDDLGAELVYARCPDTEGVGLAVYNRLIRAAGFEVITL